MLRHDSKDEPLVQKDELTCSIAARKTGDIISEKKSDDGELFHGEDDKGFKSSLKVCQEDEKPGILIKKNDKKKKKMGKKNEAGEKKIDDEGAKRNLQEKKVEVDISTKNKGEVEKKNDLDGINELKASAEPMEVEGELEKLNRDVSQSNLNLHGEDGKGNLKVCEEDVENENAGILIKKDDKKKKKGKKDEAREKKIDDEGTMRNLREKKEEIDISVKKNIDLDGINDLKDSSEPMEVESELEKLNRDVEEDKQDKDCQQEGIIEIPVKRNPQKKNKDNQGNGENTTGSELKGHVSKSKVETKVEFRRITRLTSGGASRVNEDDKERETVMTLRAKRTGDAKDDEDKQWETVVALRAMPIGGAKDVEVSNETRSDNGKDKEKRLQVQEDHKVVKHPKESKKDKNVELPVKKKKNEEKKSLVKDLTDGVTNVERKSLKEKQRRVEYVESLKDSEKRKNDFANDVGNNKKMKGCVVKNKDQTVVKVKPTVETKAELKRSTRTNTGGACGINEDPQRQDINDIGRKCEVYGAWNKFAAYGVVVEVDPKIQVHNVAMGNGNYKIQIMSAVDNEAELFRPNSQVSIIEDVVGSFTVWPKQSLKFVD
ncbi:hypothetical protein AQUCO_06300032v1 [Aquilegia coerulea]|uniref:Transposase Tnp1/En/Spm-like domain-containing protein n=1 Tax=Aquilegia coerulea TaxID=218851 RepID=A0A2G5CCV0_AQUCA|nr:hypothetical protein AQUCO_06300032v1 [Aquilegia coerulea]